MNELISRRPTTDLKSTRRPAPAFALVRIGLELVFVYVRRPQVDDVDIVGAVGRPVLVGLGAGATLEPTFLALQPGFLLLLLGERERPKAGLLLRGPATCRDLRRRLPLLLLVAVRSVTGGRTDKPGRSSATRRLSTAERNMGSVFICISSSNVGALTGLPMMP